MRSSKAKRALPVVTFATLFVAACGARTALLAPDEGDAALDAKSEHDAHDAAHEPDAVEEDAVFPDVPIISDCPDAGETLVYVLGAQKELYSFYPPTLAFKSLGTIQCPSNSTPNSMAVTRSGIAFTNFQDGNLFEISTANAACKATTYKPNQLGWATYGMGYVSDVDGGETLYVAGNTSNFSGSKGLSTIDTTAFTLSFIAQFQPKQPNCELTGTGAGQLFGFCPFASGSNVIGVDPSTAKVISSHQLAAGANPSSFAFAFWGGDFWIFAGSTGSVVTRYDPVAQKETNMGNAPIEIVGAGVSTCAPLHL